MDRDEYLRSGDIRADPEAVNYYLSKEGAPMLKDVAMSWVDRFQQECSRTSLIEEFEVTEIALIKMQLIQLFENPKCDPLKKFELYADFMNKHIGRY